MKYVIVSEIRGLGFAELVNSYLKAGYKLVGGITFESNVWYQAMVLDERNWFKKIFNIR